MARVRLTADVDPDVRRRVRIAAIERDTSVSDWVEQAVIRELEREGNAKSSHTSEMTQPGSGKSHGTTRRINADERDALVEAILADRDGLYVPPPGVKPKGSENPAKLGGGKSMAETIIEERGER